MFFNSYMFIRNGSLLLSEPGFSEFHDYRDLQNRQNYISASFKPNVNKKTGRMYAYLRLFSFAYQVGLDKFYSL